jgi:hypothetical protein
LVGATKESYLPDINYLPDISYLANKSYLPDILRLLQKLNILAKRVQTSSRHFLMFLYAKK